MLLSIVGWVAFSVAALLSLVVIAVLCTPAHIRLDAETFEKPSLGLRVRVLGGVLPIFATRWPDSGDVPSRRRSSAEERRKKRRGRPAAYAPRVARAGPHLLAATMRRIRIESFSGEVSFGLPDPADTGALYGALMAIKLPFEKGRPSAIALRPNFHQAGLEGCGYVAARFIPIVLAVPLLVFGWAVFVRPQFKTAGQ